MPGPTSASYIDELLAVSEVAGRRLAHHVPSLRRLAARWVRRPSPVAPTLSLDEVRTKILELGYERGRDLLVHAALVDSLQAELDEVIEMLRELVVAAGGTLLMPSHPLLTKQHETMWVYDVAKSRSKVGLLSERFRKTAGVRRSPFPVAPVCALGPAAEEYTADFRVQSGGVPYGKGSPYHRLTERDGQVLFFGIDFIRALTLEHVAFDLLDSENPLLDYYVHERFWVVVAGEGTAWDVKRPAKALEGRLATTAMRRMVVRSGTLRQASIPGVPLSLLDAAGFVRWHLPLVRARGWPYLTSPLRGREARR